MDEGAPDFSARVSDRVELVVEFEVEKRYAVAICVFYFWYLTHSNAYRFKYWGLGEDTDLAQEVRVFIVSETMKLHNLLNEEDVLPQWAHDGLLAVERDRNRAKKRRRIGEVIPDDPSSPSSSLGSDHVNG